MATPPDLFAMSRQRPSQLRAEPWAALDNEPDLHDDPGIWQPVHTTSPRRKILPLSILGVILLASAGIGGLMLTETQKARPVPVVAAAPAARPVAEAPAAATPAPAITPPATPTVTADGGIAIMPSDNPAILKLQKAAAKGDVKAQLALALEYQSGSAITTDPKLAQALMNNAAAAGHPPAMFQLAKSYQEGNFAAPDLHAAARWYEAAAATGHAQAAYNLGTLYEKGIDDTPDKALALGWYQRAASYGSNDALAGIARLTPKRAPLTEKDITFMQQALNEMGYDAGPANGKMGSRMADAIRAYQTTIGLMEDGRPSRFLLEQLASAAKDAGEGDR